MVALPYHILVHGTLREVGHATILSAGYNSEASQAWINAATIDRVAHGKRDLFYEKINQLTTEILLGVR